MIIETIFDKDFESNCILVLGDEFYQQTKYIIDNFSLLDLCIKKIFIHPENYSSDVIKYFKTIAAIVMEGGE